MNPQSKIESTTPTQKETIMLCPAMQETHPGAHHSMYRDTSPNGQDYWTTDCARCGEVPSCGQHDWKPDTRTINEELEYIIECQTCGHMEISTEYEHKLDKAGLKLEKALADLGEVPTLELIPVPEDAIERCGRVPKLWRMQITAYPKGSVRKFRNRETGEIYLAENTSWKPLGWDEYVDYVAETEGSRWAQGGSNFFWPSEDKFYRSRSSAQDKVNIVESWGGKAIILEAEVGAFIPAAEATARRKRVRDQKRIDALKAKIAAIDPNAV